MGCLCPGEYNTKRLQLSYPHSVAFSTSPFFALPLFLLYRLVVAFYCLAWLVFSAFHYNDYFFLYLSNWTFVLVTVYFFLGLYLTIISCCGVGDSDDNDNSDLGRFGTYRFKSETYIAGLTSSDDSETEDKNADARLYAAHWYKNEEEDGMRCYHKATWLIFTLASTNSLVVTALFWIVQFPRDHPLDGLNVTIHTLSSMFLLLEVIISNIPIQLLHHLHSHIFQSIYILFTVIYWAAGGMDGNGNKFIYPVLDYADDPSLAVASIFMMLIIALPLAQMLFFTLFRLRAWVVYKLE